MQLQLGQMNRWITALLKNFHCFHLSQIYITIFQCKIQLHAQSQIHFVTLYYLDLYLCHSQILLLVMSLWWPIFSTCWWWCSELFSTVHLMFWKLLGTPLLINIFWQCDLVHALWALCRPQLQNLCETNKILQKGL